MGLRGPQPKPESLKVLQGNFRRPAARDLADGVNPEIAIPTPPKYLTDEARKIWKRDAAALFDVGLISRLDIEQFGAYCQAAAHLHLVERSLNARMAVLAERNVDPVKAFIASTPNGYEVQSVHVQLLNSLRDQVKKFGDAFGLSPSARSRVAASNNMGQQDLPGMEKPAGWSRFSGGR